MIVIFMRTDLFSHCLHEIQSVSLVGGFFEVESFVDRFYGGVQRIGEVGGVV